MKKEPARPQHHRSRSSWSLTKGALGVGQPQPIELHPRAHFTRPQTSSHPCLAMLAHTHTSPPDSSYLLLVQPHRLHSRRHTDPPASSSLSKRLRHLDDGAQALVLSPAASVPSTCSRLLSPPTLLDDPARLRAHRWTAQMEPALALLPPQGPSGSRMKSAALSTAASAKKIQMARVSSDPILVPWA